MDSEGALDQQAKKLRNSDDRHWAPHETPARGKNLPKAVQTAYKHCQYEVSTRRLSCRCTVGTPGVVIGSWWHQALAVQDACWVAFRPEPVMLRACMHAHR